MPLDFPANPTDGQLYPAAPNSEYIYSTAKGAWLSLPNESAKTVTSDNAPSNPKDGDQWFNTVDGTLYIYIVDVDGGQWVESQAPITANGYYSPNYIINGAFDIWQRGTSAVNGIANGAFHPDRWLVITDGVGTVNSSRIDVASQGIGSQYGWRLERTAGTSRWVGIHMAEGALAQVGKTVTLSVYLRKGSALTTNVVLDISTRSAKFGAVAESRNVTIPNSAISTTSFTRFSVSLPVTAATSSANADLFEIEIVAASQAGASNAFLDIAGVQLEEGSIATTFRRNANSIQGELAACQRYFYRVPGFTNATGAAINTAGDFIVRYLLPVEMRTSPSLTISAGTFTWSDDYIADGSGTYSDAAYYSVWGNRNVRVQINTTGSSTTGRWYSFGNYNALGTSNVDFSAEL